MKTKIKFLTVPVLVLVSLCLSAFNIYASGFEGRHKGMLVKMIGLTDVQKSAIKTTLETDPNILNLRSQIKTAMPTLIAARKTLKLDTLKYFANNKTTSISTIENDMAVVSGAEVTIAPLRRQLHVLVLEDIQKTLTGSLALTSAQLTRLNQMITFLSE